MEALARLLQQAQTAVLSAQEDVITMRAQLDDGGDEAIVNPCVVDLQVGIQQKQEAAAELLKQGAALFYESMGDLETKARALGNVKTRENELEKTKKAMQRYFEAQKKTQDDLKSEYDGLLSVEESKVAHLTETASDIIQTNTGRRLAHRVLTTWLKKAMIRSFWRLHQQQEEQKEIQHTSFTQDHEALAEEALFAKRQQLLRQKLFHRWERRSYMRKNSRLMKEVKQLEKEAEFFRTECAKTQRMLSGHLQDEHARMQLTTHAQAKECELLDDEVERLKVALTELTGEFSERTQTYVRQQEETELFFKRKEQKLREALAETQTELAKVTAASQKLNTDLEGLEESVVSHIAGREHVFWAATAQKELLFMDTVGTMFGRLAVRHARSMADVAELKDNVELLAPLSEKVLRLENALAASTDLSTSHKKAARKAQQEVDQLMTVSSLLTDKLERANHRALRSVYFMAWSAHALANRKRALEEENSGLKEERRVKQKDFLVQQQNTAASHREEKQRLMGEIHDQEITIQNQRKEMEELKDQYERKEGQHYEAQLDIHNLKAKLARAEEEKLSALEKLQKARIENLTLDEDNARFSVEYKEVKWRWALHQQHLTAWKDNSESLTEANGQLAHVCEQWSVHSEKQQHKFKASIKETQQQAVFTLDVTRRHMQRESFFNQWRLWASHRQELRTTKDAHAIILRTIDGKHNSAFSTLRMQHQQAVDEMRVAHEQSMADMTAAHLADTAKQANLHEEALLQLRQSHESTEQAHARELEQRDKVHKEVCDEWQVKFDEMSDLVVLYCAQAAFTKWTAFVRDRSRGRTAEAQLQHYQQTAQHWMTARAELITQRYQRGDELLLASVATHHKEQALDQSNDYLDLLERHGQLSSLFEEVTSAGEAMERQLGKLKTEVRRLQLQLDSEKEYSSAIKTRLAGVDSRYEGHLLLCERAIRHQRRLWNTTEDHMQCVLLAFHEAADGVVMQMTREQQRQHELVLQSQEALRSAQSATTAAPPDVSSIAQDDTDSANVSLKAPVHESSAAVEETDATAITVPIPEEVQQRLRTLEDASSSLIASQHRDTPSMESIAKEMQQPFVLLQSPATPPPFPPSAPSPRPSTVKDVGHRRLPVRRPVQPIPSVEAALEVVRRSALCLVDSEKKKQEEAAEASRKKLASMEETLHDVRHSMETMLEEQRRLAADMRSELSQSRSVGVSPASTNPIATPQRGQLRQTGCESSVGTQTSAFLMDAWSERLDMLTSRYQRVLDAFCSDVEQRRETFYSVNGMLVAAEMFSEELLTRFTTNMEEMQQIRAQLAVSHDTSSGPARDCKSQGTSPVSPEAFLREQQQKESLMALQRKLADVAGEYETVLQEFLSSVAEDRSAFQLSTRMLYEADTFSEKLVSRLRQNMAAVAEAKIKPVASQTPPGRSLTGDFADASGGQAPSLDDSLEEDAPSISSSSSSGASHPASPIAATTTEKDADASVTPAKRDSPEKVILRDRVELLEKLLVQAKVQLAETRQMLALSGGTPPPLQNLSEYVAASSDGARTSEGASAMDTIKSLRQREKDMQRAHEEQLIRVRADTEQLVAMRYKDEAHQLEAGVKGLLDRLEDSSRAYEAEKARLERHIKTLSAELADNQEVHSRELDQMRRSFQREMDDLIQENAYMQEELREREEHATQEMSKLKAQLRDLAAPDRDGSVKRLSAEVKQLTQEKATLQDKAEATERELRNAVQDARAALEDAIRHHQEELSAMEARCEHLMEQAATHVPSTASGEGELIEEAARQYGGFFTQTADLVDATLTEKSLLLMDASLAAVEAYYAALLGEALQRLECEKEELETDNVHLTEQVAFYKAQAADVAAHRAEQSSGDINDISSRGYPASSPSLPQTRPLEDQDEGESPGVRVRRQPQQGSSGAASTQRNATPQDATTLAGSFGDGGGSPSPYLDPTRTPEGVVAEETPRRSSFDVSTVTPTRPTLRSRSLDSLELSQQMLRYSRMLHEQEERNRERLDNADALTAQVEDLIARGERLRAFVEREQLGPKRRR